MDVHDGNQRMSRQNPYDPFFVSTAILCAAASSSQPRSSLANLPLEILIMIFRHVKIPCYQVCLALTCKVMANAASVPTVMTKWRGWRDKTYLFYLFQKMPRPGADIAYYIPSHLQLCRACFRFRPIRREHPVEKVQSEKGDGQNAIRVWWECPDCSARGYMTYNSEAWYQDARGRQCPELKYRMDKP